MSLRAFLTHRPRLLAFQIALLGLLGWGFLEVADEVAEEESRAMDQRLLLALREPTDRDNPLGPLWLEESARDITGLGGFTVLNGLVFAAVGYLLLRRKPGTAVFLFCAAALGTVASQGLKAGFNRPRPDLVAHGSHVSSASFPSGHSMMAAIIYLTVFVLLAKVEPRRAIRSYLLVLAVILVLAIGVSRVYLGVHWPTDVLGGWALGAAWACGCWIVADFLEIRRGKADRLAVKK